MNRLTDIGFRLAGHWLLVDGKLKFDAIRHAEQRNVLYAFVCDGQVRYVGKSIQKLRERMGGYRSPGPKSTTNIRNRQNILELLAAGAAVDIYALPDNGLMHYGSFHLNLAAALEDSIIDTLRPEWNRPNRKNRTTLDSGEEEAVPTGVDTSDSDTGQQAADDVPVDNHIPVVSTFEFTLQPTYWNQGFFNAGVTGSPALGADGEEIEIFFGDETIPTLGSINRVTTGNDTPRVFGGAALGKRFQTLPVKTKMLVEVMSPVSIRIRPAL